MSPVKPGQITPNAKQLRLLASVLRLSDATTSAVHAVLVDGSTQAAAGKLSGITQPQVARALGSIRRLDASIRAAYLPVRRSP